jgi:hypothetical protein
MEWGALTLTSISALSLTYSLLNQIEQAEIPDNCDPTPRFFVSINTLAQNRIFPHLCLNIVPWRSLAPTTGRKLHLSGEIFSISHCICTSILPKPMQFWCVTNSARSPIFIRSHTPIFEP